MGFVKWTAAALAVAAVTFLASCGGGGGSGDGGGNGKALKIAVIPKGTSNEYWKIVHAGAVKAQLELAPTQKVDIIWKGPVKEDQADEQISLVEDMLNSQVDAIVLAPNSYEQLADVVNRAAKKNVPVIIVDSGVKTDTYKTMVATNNKDAGYKGGLELADELGGKGKIIMLRYDSNQESTKAREEGFLQAMNEKHIDIVDVDKYGGVTADKCQTAAENLLDAHTKDGAPNFDGIFCPNWTTTFGMLRALEDRKLAGKVKFVGFDADKDLAQAMRDKKIGALVVQNPMNMGYMGVMRALDIIHGKTVDKSIDSGVNIIKQAEVDSPANKELLTPDLTKYLKE